MTGRELYERLSSICPMPPWEQQHYDIRAAYEQAALLEDEPHVRLIEGLAGIREHTKDMLGLTEKTMGPFE